MRLSAFLLSIAVSCAVCPMAEAGKPLDALDQPATLSPEGLKRLSDQLKREVGRAPDTIRPSSSPGLMEAQWGSLFAYVTLDGRYVIYGDLVDLSNDEEITEKQRRADRLVAIDQLGIDNMIEYAPAPPVQGRYVVTVFTDVDCGYCRQLHREIADYNALGITIRYVFYPRTGPDTESFKKAVAVWCSSNHKLALTRAKAGAPLVGNPQCPNPIQREYELGQSFGIRGTPLLVLPNGAAVSGYLPPDALLARLTDASAKGSATAP